MLSCCLKSQKKYRKYKSRIFKKLVMLKQCCNKFTITWTSMINEASFQDILLPTMGEGSHET